MPRLHLAPVIPLPLLPVEAGHYEDVAGIAWIKHDGHLYRASNPEAPVPLAEALPHAPFTRLLPASTVAIMIAREVANAHLAVNEAETRTRRHLTTAAQAVSGHLGFNADATEADITAASAWRSDLEQQLHNVRAQLSETEALLSLACEQLDEHEANHPAPHIPRTFPASPGARITTISKQRARKPAPREQ